MPGTNKQHLHEPPSLSGDKELDDLNLEIYAYLNGLPTELKPYAVALSNIYHGAFVVEERELAQLMVDGGGILFKSLVITVNGAPLEADYLRSVSRSLFDLSARGADLVREKSLPTIEVKALNGQELQQLLGAILQRRPENGIEDIQPLPPEKLN